jgi:adenosylcobyric acid synthase
VWRPADAGADLHDPEGHDGQAVQTLPGLGLLPLHTRFGAAKRLRAAPVRFGSVHGTVGGAQRRAGCRLRDPLRRRPTRPAQRPCCTTTRGQAIGWQQGAVLGVYAHGLFESPVVLQALFGAAVPTLESSFELLADLVEEHLDAALLERWLGA